MFSLLLERTSDLNESLNEESCKGELYLLQSLVVVDCGLLAGAGRALLYENHSREEAFGIFLPPKSGFDHAYAPKFEIICGKIVFLLLLWHTQISRFVTF